MTMCTPRKLTWYRTFPPFRKVLSFPCPHPTIENWCSDFYHHWLVWSGLGFQLHGITRCGIFHVWLLSLTSHLCDSFNLLHVSAVSPFLLPNGIPLYGYTIICLSSFSWRTFGLFLVWGFCEQRAMHICVKIFLEITCFHFFWENT